MKLFIDIETTGTSWGTHSPISIASIITNNNLEVVHKNLTHVKPVSFHTWDDEAENIHKITKSEARAFKPPLQAANDYVSMLEEFKTTEFYCHALSTYGVFRIFDYQLMIGWLRILDGDASNELERRFEFLFNDRVYSTIAKNKVYQRTLNLENQRLNTWAKHIDFELNHHNAMSDCECLFEVYKYQLKLESNHWKNIEKKGEMI